MRWVPWSAASLVVVAVACTSPVPQQGGEAAPAPERIPTAPAQLYHEAPPLDPTVASLEYIGTREIGFAGIEGPFDRRMDSFRMSNHGPAPLFYQVSVDQACLPRRLEFLSDDGTLDEDLWRPFVCPFGIIATPVQPGESVEMDVDPREGWAGRLGILCWTEEPENGTTSDPANTAMLWSEPYRSGERILPPRECE